MSFLIVFIPFIFGVSFLTFHSITLTFGILLINTFNIIYNYKYKISIKLNVYRLKLEIAINLKNQ